MKINTAEMTGNNRLVYVEDTVDEHGGKYCIDYVVDVQGALDVRSREYDTKEEALIVIIALQKAMIEQKFISAGKTFAPVC